jgi:hypothetical protein
MRPALLFAMLAATPAHAAEALWTPFEGTYETRPRVATRIGVRIVRIDEQTYGASIRSAKGEQSGRLWGTGKLLGDNMAMRVDVTGSSGCELTIRFVGKAKRVADIDVQECGLPQGVSSQLKGRVYQIHD